MRKKVDGRVRALIEAGVASGHRSLLVVVGDGGKEQVANLHYMLSKAQVKARPSVLWCYKKELGFSSHRKKRMSQIKKKASKHTGSAAAAAGAAGEEGMGATDPFELFISSTEITYAYYKDSARVLGRTFGMTVLQDFEALTPNVLARTVETVAGGGLVVLLLGKLDSLRQLHDLAMDAHSRLRTPSSGAVVPRFNGRFLLSLADCHGCLVVDDELNVLPISAHAHALGEADGGEEGSGKGAKAQAKAKAELDETVRSLADVPVAGVLLPLCRSADQAKALLTVAEALLDKTLRQTVALTAGRGRGKSAALGLALAAAIGHGYANVFVTAPSLENVQTVFEFALKGLDKLAYAEHADYSVREAAAGGVGVGDELGADGGGEGDGSRGRGLRCIARINVFRSHRQTILYVRPDDAAAVRHAEMVVVDEAAAIPLPLVKGLLGPWLCVLSSTVNGYEGTGRALSLKLIKGLRDKAADNNPGRGSNSSTQAPSRTLREVTLVEPIRYSAGDPVEAWLHSLLCLDASNAVKPVLGCPHPSACELYLVERDTLFSYHRASEAFLQRLVGLCVSSHYKNSPNDLLLLADAPGHVLYALLGPTPASVNGEARLPDVLAVILITRPWSMACQTIGRVLVIPKPPLALLPPTPAPDLADADFAALSGARVVRIATHPDLGRMGYGSRALQLLRAYYSGEIPLEPKPSASLPVGKRAKEGGVGGLLAEAIEPASADSLPPLLRRLSEVQAPRLDYMGTAFGLNYELLQFWRKAGFAPVYLRQQANDTTGEHSLLMLSDLTGGKAGSARDWLGAFHSDFCRRFMNLCACSVLKGAADVFSALALLQPVHADGRAAVAGEGAFCSLSAQELDVLLTPYDVQRLRAYARNMVDHHLIADLTPTLAALCLGPNPKLRCSLSSAQQAILLALGLRRQTADEAAAALKLPVAQLLALFAKVTLPAAAVAC
ncbi:helicase-domain-containing protein [Pavlovales sp. CCMP2436]|nr:helicase-domain-containing protein [Pavlovales sp. CCMP2436]